MSSKFLHREIRFVLSLVMFMVAPCSPQVILCLWGNTWLCIVERREVRTVPEQKLERMSSPSSLTGIISHLKHLEVYVDFLLMFFNIYQVLINFIVNCNNGRDKAMSMLPWVIGFVVSVSTEIQIHLKRWTYLIKRKTGRALVNLLTEIL